MAPAGNADNLRNRVRIIRAQQGLTQEELGAAVGLTRQSIIAIEKGRFTPSIHTALKLAAVLGTLVDELFWLAIEQEQEDDDET
jgi:putative transcriptional regulator